MRALILILLFVQSGIARGEGDATDDLALLADMVAARERAMIAGDLPAAISQFADEATWINSQGYLFEGKEHITAFHRMLADEGIRGAYRYVAGNPRIRLLDGANALVYYAWKMLWHPPATPDIITREEIGLMTLTAQKRQGRWRWVAVTNQHTDEFYPEIEPVTVH